MDLLGLLGLLLVVAGVYFLVTGGIILGVVCIIVGLFLMGYIGSTRGRGTRL